MYGVPVLQLAQRRRGNGLFQREAHEEALQAYHRAKSMLDMVEGRADGDQQEVNANMAIVTLNIAAVHLAQQHYVAAADSCSDALQLQPNNVKGLVRRSRCYSRMHEYAVRFS